MNYASIIKEIGRGAKGSRSISTADAQAVFGDMLDGTVPDLELGAIVIALRLKSESLAELIGFKHAMDARCAQLEVPGAGRCVVLPTYNGARRQANLMPLVALLLEHAGVPVLIQGRHDFDTRSSPFELLAALGMEVSPSLADAEARLARRSVACVKLDQLLPGLDRLLGLRLRFGVRGSAHTMAKLVDPCRGHSVRVVAVTHPEYLERMSEFLAVDGGRAMLLRGTEGESFANPRRRPRMEVFRDGVGEVAWPAEDGGAPPLVGLPDVPGVAENAALIRAMVDGSVPIPQPILDQVAALANLVRAD